MSFTELPILVDNIKQVQWDKQYTDLRLIRVLASDISRILAGKQFDPIERFMSPNPRMSRTRTLEQIEMTLMQWAKE